jgi:hypothetical protein
MTVAIRTRYVDVAATMRLPTALRICQGFVADAVSAIERGSVTRYRFGRLFRSRPKKLE